MEEIRKKLEASSQALCPLSVTEGALIRLKQLILKNQSATNHPEEIQLLWDLCQSEHPVVALDAVKTLMELVEEGVLELDGTISTLTSLAYQIKHPEGLVWAVSQLLDGSNEQNYGLTSRIHPYVALMRSYPSTWPHIHAIVREKILDPRQDLEKVMANLRPVWMFLFCNPNHHGQFSAFRHAFIQDLVSLPPGATSVSKFCLALIQWMPMDSKVAAYEQYQIVRQIWLILGFKATWVLPYLCNTLKVLSDLGLSPRIVTRDILENWNEMEISESSANECAIILSYALGTTSSYYQPALLEIMERIVDHKTVRPRVAGLVVYHIMTCISQQSSLTSKLDAIIKRLYAILRENNQPQSLEVGEEHFHHPFTAIGAKARQVLRLILVLEESDRSTTNWLKTLERSNIADYTDFLPLVSAVALSTSCPAQLEEVMNIFGRVIQHQPELSQQVLTIIMHKLSQKNSPRTQLALLKRLPTLGKDKLSIGVALQLINSLGSRPGLGSIRLQLLFDLWILEDRVYPQLRKALEDLTTLKTMHDYEFQLAKAVALRGICQKSPTKYGADLLPMLSEILNKYVDEIDSCLCCMALDGIFHLCQSEVIDIRTTVMVLWPKMWIDPRTKVRQNFYKILGVIALFHLDSPVYQEFKSDSLHKIWIRIQDPQYPDDKIELFRTLCQFSIEDHKLKMLPEYARHNLKYPDGFVAKDDGSLRPRPEEVWEVIPSDVWPRLVSDCEDDNLQDSYVNLLVKLIGQELAEMPRGAYYLSQAMKNRGEEPEDYHFLKEGSILRGLVLLCQRVSRDKVQAKNAVIKKLLSILASHYPQHFPPLNWTFLIHIKKHPALTLTIACQQCEHSRSAKGIVEKAIQNDLDDHTQSSVLVMNGFTIGAALDEDLLDQVFETGLSNRLQSIQNHADVEGIKSLMLSLKCSKSSPILAKWITHLNKIIPQEEEELYEVYLDLIHELPTKTLDQMSNTTHITHVSSSQLYRSLSIRVHLACSTDTDHPLTWLNACIESLAKTNNRDQIMPEMFSALSRVINHGRIQFPQANRQWFLELMGQMRAMLRPGGDPKVFKILFEVFQFAIVQLAHLECWTHPKERLTTAMDENANLLTHAVAELLLSKSVHWNKLGPQICEWMLSLLSESSLPPTCQPVIISALPAFKYAEQYSETSIWGRVVMLSTQ